jgi:hypothetical protein
MHVDIFYTTTDKYGQRNRKLIHSVRALLTHHSHNQAQNTQRLHVTTALVLQPVSVCHQTIFRDKI